MRMLSVLTAVLILATSCSRNNAATGLEEEHVFVETRTFPSDTIESAEIRFSKVNSRGYYRGDVSATFTATGSITITSKKTIAFSKKPAEEYKQYFVVHADIINGLLLIATEFPKNLGTDVYGWIDYEISAPHGTHLTIVAKSGDVSIGPGAGSLNIESLDGDITTTLTDGPMRVKTNNGSVSVSDCRGPVDIFSINGSVTVENCPFAADIKSVNSKIVFNPGTPPLGDINISSPNGDISIMIDKHSELDIRAETTTGNININLLKLEKPLSDKEYHTVMNAPSHMLNIKSINGSIELNSD